MYKRILLSSVIALFAAQVNAQNNVGIGTDNPASKATINGNLSVGASYTATPAPANGAIIQGQVGIGTLAPNSSTILDIASSNKGVRFPNVALTGAADVTTIPSPPQGLVVWNTGANWGTAGLYINTGTSGTPAWDKTSTGSGTVSGVTAGSPLSSSGGTSPNITLSGIVPVANGGTGLNTFGGTNRILYTTTANNLSSITTANNGVLVTNGSGVPSIGSTLPAAVQSSITSVGTITSGTWNGGILGLAYGGTNTNLSAGGATGDLLIANSATSFARYAAGTNGYVLKSNGPGTAPTWQVDNNSGGTVTGTGTSTQVAFWSGTSALTSSSNLYWDNTNSRLGITTNSPVERLDLGLNPTVMMSGNSNAWGFKLNVNDYGSGNVPLRFIKRTAGTDTEVMRLSQSGYLGILNTDPQQALDVTGTGRFSDNLYWGGPGTNGIEESTGDGASYSVYNFALRGWYGMALKDYSGTVHGVYDFRTGNLTTDGVLNFQGTGNNLLAGKLGVGTTSPSYGLDLQGGSSTLRVKRPDGTPANSGGTVTTSGGYTYVKFTSSGTFTPNGTANVEVLVVAGGGGGGANGGGGGGAGGVVYSSSYTVTGPVTVTVGNGGNGGISTVQGSNGGNSSFGTLIAYGGGGGASRDGGLQGQSGGSGGGGGGASGSPRHVPGSGTFGQGSSGGYGTTPDQGCNSAGGGGGGAGGAGTGAGLTAGGNGGAGIQYAQFAAVGGSPAGWFGGGGAGGPTCAGTHGTGGTGGGGSGGTGGTANTGGGGGGAGAAGGSGVVIIRYPTSTAFTNAATLVASSNGYVGIGTESPQAPLHVVGSSGNTASSFIKYINYANTSVNSNNAWVGTVGIYSESDILARGSVIATSTNAFSDKRIKDVIGISDRSKDLDILNKIEITKYKYIDSIAQGSRVHTKVIAQQVEQVYPEAVMHTTGFLPDIYALTENIAHNNATGELTITINKQHNLQPGDKVKLIDETGNERIAGVVKVNDNNTFTVTSKNAASRMFVYGKQVKDFRAVDYEALSMLGISAIQELTQRIKTLEETNAHLKEQNIMLGRDKADLQLVNNQYGQLKAQLDELKTLMQQNGIRTEK